MLQSPQVNAFVVIDEAHYIKQLYGRWANAVLQIAAFAKTRWYSDRNPNTEKLY